MFHIFEYEWLNGNIKKDIFDLLVDNDNTSFNETDNNYEIINYNSNIKNINDFILNNNFNVYNCGFKKFIYTTKNIV